MRAIGRIGFVLLLASAFVLAAASPAILVQDESKDRVACHEKENPGIVGQYEASQHRAAGVG